MQKGKILAVPFTESFLAFQHAAKVENIHADMPTLYSMTESPGRATKLLNDIPRISTMEKQLFLKSLKR